jgi:hypothetical protein
MFPEHLFPVVINCLVRVDREENLEYARDILLTKLIEVVELEPIRQEQEAIHPHLLKVPVHFFLNPSTQGSRNCLRPIF